MRDHGAMGDCRLHGSHTHTRALRGHSTGAQRRVLRTRRPRCHAQTNPLFMKDQVVTALGNSVSREDIGGWANYHMRDDTAADGGMNMSQPWWGFLDLELANDIALALLDKGKAQLAEHFVRARGCAWVRGGCVQPSPCAGVRPCPRLARPCASVTLGHPSSHVLCACLYRWGPHGWAASRWIPRCSQRCSAVGLPCLLPLWVAPPRGSRWATTLACCRSCGWPFDPRTTS